MSNRDELRAAFKAGEAYANSIELGNTWVPDFDSWYAENYAALTNQETFVTETELDKGDYPLAGEASPATMHHNVMRQIVGRGCRGSGKSMAMQEAIKHELGKGKAVLDLTESDRPAPPYVVVDELVTTPNRKERRKRRKAKS